MEKTELADLVRGWPQNAVQQNPETVIKSLHDQGVNLRAERFRHTMGARNAADDAQRQHHTEMAKACTRVIQTRGEQRKG